MAYDAEFFDYVDSGAIRSAEVVLGTLLPHLKPVSVLDVGCGRGGWAACWKRLAGARVHGLDGDYLPREALYIEPGEFTPVDLSRPFDLGKRFDLVQCLEVAEHLPPESSRPLVASICRHANIVLFSAAVPGQGGTHHVNERPLDYWRELFWEAGYSAYDFLRPLIHRRQDVEPWYRFNSVLYAKADTVLPTAIRASEVRPDQPLRSFGSPAWWLRRALVRQLPAPLVSRLASWNAAILRLTSAAGRPPRISARSHPPSPPR